MTAQWLAVHLPQLSLEAFRATLPPEVAARPVVLLEGHRIAAVNAQAAARGVRTGMQRATAMALAPDLLPGQADPARDAAACAAVAHAALAFTPSVSLHGAQTVLLEVHASLRCFGGLAALRDRLLQALAPPGAPAPHRMQLAAAPTALGAALLACWAPADRGDLVLGPHARQLPALQRLLDAAPVWMLGPGREHWEALQGMGLHTLADLRQLPRAGLARRFGEGLLDDLDRACGLRADPRCWVEAPARFDSRLELYARADTTEQVLAGAAVLLSRLVAWARARQSRIAAFTLAMQHEPRHRETRCEATQLHLELAEPALDAAHLQLLLRERLAHCTLTAPTLELRLHCMHTVQAAAPNQELFPTRASAATGLARLLERLRARLGDAQVQRLVAVADHRPERASRTEPALAAPGRRDAAPALRAGGGPAVCVPLPLHRPVWLLPEPLPLGERGALPLLEGRPLRLVSGPERIEAGWWDGEVAARDYFIAQADDGSLVWIWRARLPPAPNAPPSAPQWFLHGRYG